MDINSDQFKKVLNQYETWALSEKLPFSSEIFSKLQIDKEIWHFSFYENPEEKKKHVFTPASLAKVLEKKDLDQNGVNGVVYTPLSIVKAMVDYTIDQYLWNQIKNYRKIHLCFDSHDELKYIPLESRLIKLYNNLLLEQNLILFDFILEKVLPSITILDPCVGGGIFLYELVKKLIFIIYTFYPWFYFLKKKQKTKENIEEKKEDKLLFIKWITFCKTFYSHSYSSNRELNPKFSFIEQLNQISESLLGISINNSFKKSLMEKIFHYVQNNLFFIDTNPDALKVTKIRIYALLFSNFGLSLPNIAEFKWNACLSNLLLLQSNFFPNNFDIIIGNPPYISSDSMARTLPKNELSRLKDEYREIVQRGSKPDYYFYFFQKGIEILKPSGLLTYIIPNRILSNNYADALRKFLFKSSQIQTIIDFSSQLSIFPSINIHPCIISLKKTQSPHLGDLNDGKSVETDIQMKWNPKNRFLGAFVEKAEEIESFNLAQLQYHPISIKLCRNYNLLFVNLSSSIQMFLLDNQNLPKVGDILSIHEATRLARFQHKLPEDIPVRISCDIWNTLPETKQKFYVREIRGKNIQRFFLKLVDSYLTLPDLLLESQSINNSPEKYFNPTVYIRELGKIVYTAFDDKQAGASIGYGGVYFFNKSDFKQIIVPDSNVFLKACTIYFGSKIVLFCYRYLYTTGSWGDSLKFRSNYLKNMPFIPFYYQLFALFYDILSLINQFLYISSRSSTIISKITNFLETASKISDWVENLVDLTLIMRYNVIIESKIFFQESFSINEYISTIPDTTFEKIIFAEFSKISLPDINDEIVQFIKTVGSNKKVKDTKLIEDLENNTQFQSILHKFECWIKNLQLMKASLAVKDDYKKDYKKITQSQLYNLLF